MVESKIFNEYIFELVAPFTRGSILLKVNVKVNFLTSNKKKVKVDCFEMK